MSRFTDFRSVLSGKARELARETLADFSKEATRDARAFIAGAKDDLKRWTEELARGDLTRKDFEWLVEGRKDLAKMEALEKAGLAQVRIQAFRDSLLQLVITTAFDVFL